MNDPFTREISLILEETTSPKAKSRMLARFAREEIERTQSANEAAIGRTIRKPLVTVDGKRGAALGTVRPDGTIVAEFNTETSAVLWVMRALAEISPELSGSYERSHVLYADAREVAPSTDVPSAREYVIVSDLPYARKLDRADGLPPRSQQAPNGVYEAVAAVASKRFGEEFRIRFTFREAPTRGGKPMRQPAIVITPT